MIRKNRTWNRFILFFTAALSLNILFINCGIAASEDKIVAIVNSDIVTQSEVQKKVNLLRKQMAASPEAKTVNDAELRKKVLDTIIDRDLQLQLAKKSGITITEMDVDKSLANIAKKGGATVAVMQKELKAQGINFADFREELKDSMIINRLQQQALSKGITVSDQEAQDFLNKASKMMAQSQKAGQREKQEYHLLNIFIQIPDNATADDKSVAEGKATLVIDKLEAGADYNQILLADKTLRGQDLGWRTISQMPDIFAAQVVKMQRGDVAGAIPAPNGYHIIKLLEVRENTHLAAAPETRKLTLMDAKEMVFRQKLEEKATDWIKGLRSSAYIKMM